MNRFWKHSLSVSALLVLANCSYTTPPLERPVPDDSGVAKSFFQEVVTQTVYVKDSSTPGNEIKVSEADANDLELLTKTQSGQTVTTELTQAAIASGWRKSVETVIRPKTFLCGWAAQGSAGADGAAILDNYNHANHCNIEFDITKDALIGRMVMPSKIGKRNEWPNVVTIPITKHYYYEHPKDKYGRDEKSKYVENTDKDHWSQRPMMRLNLKSIQINDWAMALFWGDFKVDKVEDEEWDFENNFLGFTITASNNYFRSSMQGRFRFNFLQFRHDESFARTMFSAENAKHINVLHILGEQVNGVDQILYAGKWDTRKKHTIYLNNFPNAYKQIGIDVIEHWNDVFEKIGHGRPFTTAFRDGAQYTFDMRYPGITWIDDVEASYSAPLGVGMVAADVRNGKVLWGGVAIWGGLLEKIINRYSPAENALAMGARINGDGPNSVQFSLGEPELPFEDYSSVVPGTLMEVPSLDQAREMIRSAFESKRDSLLHYQGLIDSLPKNPEERIQKLSEILSDTSGYSSYNPVRTNLFANPDARLYFDVNELATEMGIPGASDPLALNLTGDDRSIDLFASVNSQNGTLLAESTDFNSDIAAELSRVVAALNGETRYLDILAQDLVRQVISFKEKHQNFPARKEVYNMDNFQKLIGQPTLSDSVDSFPFQNLRSKQEFLEQGQPLTKTSALKYLVETVNSRGSGIAAFDFDRRASDLALQYQMGFEKYGVNKILALKPVVKDLLLHEMGHVLGLGHNFKENILPARGSVPSKYLDGEDGLVAKAHSNQTNYSTVMGYKNGVTDVITDYQDLKPGPMDELVLRYLYNGEYPAMPADPVQAAASETDFKFAKINEDGKIHENLLRVTYTACGLRTGVKFNQARIEDFNQCSDGIREMIVPSVDDAHLQAAANNERIAVQSIEDYKLSYFPQCNDFTASRSFDPYCNRWDRGYDALTLTEGYFDDFRARLTNSLYAFPDGPGADFYWRHEYSLWANSLRTFGRTRVFYDYMRQKYANDIEYVLNVGSGAKIDSLLQFSEACSDDADPDAIKNPRLFELFHSDTEKSLELRKLCQATKLFVRELTDYLQMDGPDYPFIDRFNRYISYSIFGGEANPSFGAAFGKWKEMPRTPIKIPALYALTLPYAFNAYGAWTMPIWQYTSNDGLFLVNTFFPKEYTQALTSTVTQNLTLSNLGQEKRTKIGKSILSLGFLLAMNYFSNDALDVSDAYIKNLRSQARYKYNWAIVEVEAKRNKEENNELVRNFQGTIYNAWGRGSEKIPEIYMYRENQTVIIPPSGSLILPYSDLRWTSPSGGYYFVIKLDYDDDYFDRLKTHSVRRALEARYYQTMKACTEGTERSGLKFYFNDTISKNLFPGFDFPEDINSNENSRKKFYKSIDTYFSLYYNNRSADGSTTLLNSTPDPNACEDALKGQQVIVMAAAALNGNIFLDIYDRIEKDISSLFQFFR